MQKMSDQRILYVTTVDLRRCDAPARHVVEACRAFVDLGCVVTLLGPDIRGGIPPKVTAIKIWHPRVRGAWRLIFPVMGWWVARLSHDADIVYFRCSPSKWLVRAISKCVNSLTVVEINGLEGLSPTYRSMIDMADRVLVSSSEMKTRLVEIAGIKHAKVGVHWSVGVNPKIMYPEKKEACIEKLELETDQLLLFVSSYRKHHDFDTILETMALMGDQIHPGKFVFVGDGVLRPEIERRVTNRFPRERYMFVREQSPDRLRLWICSAAVCIDALIPSKIDEGSLKSQKLYDYLACGALTVYSVKSGESVPQWGDGVLFPFNAGDPISLSHALVKAMVCSEDVQLRKKALEVSSFVRKTFSWKNVGARTLRELKNR